VPEYWVRCHHNVLHDSPGLPGAYAEAALLQPTHADTWTSAFQPQLKVQLLSDKIAQKHNICLANSLVCTLHKLSRSTQFNISFIKLFCNVSSPEDIWY
jgi:hypothetical protein